MKVARWLLGRFASPHFRSPVRPSPKNEPERLLQWLAEIGVADV